MNDLISRAAVIDALRTHERKASKKWFDNQLDIEWNNAIDICCYDIEDLPSAQPDIIRCPDCYYNDGTAYCELHFRNVKAKDFCSWAERRE